MTRVMTGVRGGTSETSQITATTLLGTPPGWSLCGYLGLIAAVNPWARPLTRVLDLLLLERHHCHKALLRSIERAGK